MEEICYYGVGNQAKAKPMDLLKGLKGDNAPVIVPFSYIFDDKTILDINQYSFPWPVIARFYNSNHQYFPWKLISSHKELLEKITLRPNDDLKVLISLPPIIEESESHKFYYVGKDFLAISDSSKKDLVVLNSSNYSYFESKSLNKNCIYRFMQNNDGIWHLDNIINENDPIFMELYKNRVTDLLLSEEVFNEFILGLKDSFSISVNLFHDDGVIDTANFYWGRGFIGNPYYFGKIVGEMIKCLFRKIFKNIKGSGVAKGSKIFPEKIDIELLKTFGSDHIIEYFEELRLLYNSIQGLNQENVINFLSKLGLFSNKMKIHTSDAIVFGNFIRLNLLSEQDKDFDISNPKEILDYSSDFKVKKKILVDKLQYRVVNQSSDVIKIRFQAKALNINYIGETFENDLQSVNLHTFEQQNPEFDILIKNSDSLINVNKFKSVVLGCTFSEPSNAGSEQKYCKINFKENCFTVISCGNETEIFNLDFFLKKADEFYHFDVDQKILDKMMK